VGGARGKWLKKRLKKFNVAVKRGAQPSIIHGGYTEKKRILEKLIEKKRMDNILFKLCFIISQHPDVIMNTVR